jgi:hypothetical protein
MMTSTKPSRAIEFSGDIAALAVTLGMAADEIRASIGALILSRSVAAHGGCIRLRRGDGNRLFHDLRLVTLANKDRAIIAMEGSIAELCLPF